MWTLALAVFAAATLAVAGPAKASANDAAQPAPAFDGAPAALYLADALRSGVDYVKMNVDWPAFFRSLKATGRDFIGRYLPIVGAMHRCVTTTELAAAAAAGIDCFFWFETMNDLYRAGDGYAAGVADATEALGALVKLGAPTTTPVYYTVDWDNTDGSLIDAYFRGIASVVPVSQIGAYGNYTTIDWLYQRDMATYFCQSNAWFDERGWHPAAGMHQDIATHSIGGVWVDRLTVTTALFGQNSRYEQVDPRLLYVGAWQTGTLPAGSYSGSSYRYSTDSNATIRIAFDGTRLGWIAKRGPTPGKALVSLDGAAPVMVDLYAASTVYKQRVWETGDLSEGLHEVTITRSSGTVNVDAFDVTGVLLSMTRTEDTSDALRYEGAWSATDDPAASGSSYMLTNAGDASLTVQFTGRSLDVLTTTSPIMGAIDLAVDGIPAATVDLYASATSFRQRVWGTGGLPTGHHAVTITRSAGSPAGSYVNLDALEIVGLTGVPPAVTGVVPDYSSALGGKTVVITGRGFTGLAGPGAVTFGGTSADSYTVDSATRISAVTPAHDLGEVQVQVVAAGGVTPDTDADDLTYMPPVSYAYLRGSDRYDTAIRVSQAMFPEALPLGAGLVLAPGETFAEGLCAAPLAATCGGPVLLSYTVGLPNGVRDEILRLTPAQVFCVGLPEVVVSQVAAAVGEDAAVTTINGQDGNVYDMSRKVAEVLADKRGDMGTATAVVTIGTAFPDAISTSPLACAQQWPVLLTDKADGSPLHPSAVAALAELGIVKVLKVGTYAALPAGVEGIANLSGSDRYITDVNVAEWGKTHAGLHAAHVGLVTGDKFPDALAAGPYLALEGGILLLSPLNGPVPKSITSFVAADLAAVREVTFIACIEPVIGTVRTLLP